MSVMTSQNHQHLNCLPNRLFRRTTEKNIKAPRYWPLWGEFTGGRSIPLTKVTQKCLRLTLSSEQNRTSLSPIIIGYSDHTDPIFDRQKTVGIKFVRFECFRQFTMLWRDWYHVTTLEISAMGFVYYSYVEMNAMLSQITGVSMACSTVFRRRLKKNQSSASLSFVWGIHRSPVNSPHEGPVTRKMFPFDYVIILYPSQ